MERVCRAAGWTAIAVLQVSLAYGQTTATLRGQVRDAQGAAVPSATVIVSSAATGLSRTAPTASDGTFVVANLPPGVVDLTVTARGFAEAKRTGLVLEVGQAAAVEIELTVAGVREAVDVAVSVTGVDTTRSVVDAVIPSTAIEALPLNGRNFLQLALLVPGNAPAPNFDPTKSNSVVISSAGQLGRGGNITVDGADNNDDVVGGPLQNVTQESVQEFQIATNRFTAESGRSASSVINVVTKSGSDRLRGSVALFARDHRWQGLPATFDRSSGDTLPFDRQQVAGAAGGPLVSGKMFWFGAAEYRNQDGAVLVGARDVAARTIQRTFAPAPLDDLLGSGRVDWRPNSADTLMVRYAGEQATDTGASSLDRAIGSASQRQRSRNTYHSTVGTWTRVLSPALLNAATVSFSTFDNAIAPVASGPQLTFPSIQDGTSFRVPQGTTQTRLQIADTVNLVRGAHSLRAGGEWQRVDSLFDLGVFREGRIELIEDFASFDRNGDGRVDDEDLLFEVTLRSGKPDQDLVLPDADNDHVAVFVQDDWRVRPTLTLNLGLRYEVDTDVKNISRVDEINPIVQPFLQGTRTRDRNNFGPRIGFNWAPGDGRTSVRGGYGIYYDRVTLQIQSLERGLDGRALPIEVRAGNVFFLDPATGRVPPFAPSICQRVHGVHPDRRRGVGDQHHRQRAPEPERAAMEPRVPACAPPRRRAPGRRRAQSRHALHHRPHHRRGLQPGRRRARSRRQSRVEREHALRRAARERRAPRPPPWLPQLVHVREGAQLRQRRSDPVRERAHRSDQPAPRVRPDPQRSAAPLHRGGVGGGPGRISRGAHLDDRLGGADGHPDARRAVAHPGVPAQCGRTPVQDGRRFQPRGHGAERRRGRRRRAPAAGPR